MFIVARVNLMVSLGECSVEFSIQEAGHKKHVPVTCKTQALRLFMISMISNYYSHHYYTGSGADEPLHRVGYPDPSVFCINVGYALAEEICFIFRKHEVQRVYSGPYVYKV